MLWIAIGVVLAAVGAFAAWWVLRRRRHRLVSIVALVSEPKILDTAVLAQVAGRVWRADLGDGASPGADGFVAGDGPLNTIAHQGRMFLVNSLPQPYTPDAEQVATGITDLRSRELFLQHRAWFSCDAFGVDGRTPEPTVRELYRRLASVFVELLDENCLLVYLPESNLVFPINADTENALRADDPIAALQLTMSLPIVEVADDDPQMAQAAEMARREWPAFVAAFESRSGDAFSVKAPVSCEGNTEFIWISVTALEGDRVFGTLGNDPGSLGSLKFGSKVAVPVAELNDWLYKDRQGNLAGGFTVRVVQRAQSRKRTR
jgi:uncharacterized protein YegJ (DUF2314 family)